MEIQFYHVGGACFLLNVDRQFTIACDPALSPEGTEYAFKSFNSVRVKPPVYESGLFKEVDLWLVTHAHTDHLDEPGIGQIAPESVVLADKKSSAMIAGERNVATMGWGERKKLARAGYQIEVTAVPAYHGSNLLMRTMVGRVNGYFIRIYKDGTARTIYIAGDTVYHPSIIKRVQKLGRIDLLIANLGEVLPDKFGGPLTMSPRMLGMMADRLQPSRVIPVHIDDFSHYTTKPEDVTAQGFQIPPQGCWTFVL